LFVTGTDTGIGKTVVAGAIADWFRRKGARVAVLKPVATGCVRRR
jgi:dethiobiotin synthetase